MRHLCWPNLNLHMMDRSLKRGYIKHISNRKWILFCPIKKTQFDQIRGAARIPGLIIQVLMMLKSHLSLSQLAINMTKMKITKIWIEILKVFKTTEEQFHQEIYKRIAFNYYQTKIKKYNSHKHLHWYLKDQAVQISQIPLQSTERASLSVQIWRLKDKLSFQILLSSIKNG
jgi:hypothetical protein